MTTRAGTGTRTVAIALLTALVLGAAAGAAFARSGSTGGAAPGWHVTHRSKAPAAPAHARLLACRRSPSLDGRTAVLGAWMRPLEAGQRLALRIDLLERTPGTRWMLRSDVPGLGAWTSPSDALVGTRAGDVFKYRQAVGRLEVPAAYRFRVAFRWLDAGGAVVRESGTTTHPCRQPDLRPDLVLDVVRATPSPRGGGLVRYAVVVRNAGRAPAWRALVAATLPGDATPGAHVRSAGRLDPGERAVVAFTGPGCAADELPAAFTADPANLLDEAHEGNNELAAACPAP